MSNNFKKIVFRYYSDVLEEETVETMWAEIIDEENGIYKLDSIPFYGPKIATDDIFYAEYEKNEEHLVFKNVIEYSGNSIIQVIVLKDSFDKEIIREKLNTLNCMSEGLNDKYFSVEILESNNYEEIKNLLDMYENEGIIAYAEPVLSDKHFMDISNNINLES